MAVPPAGTDLEDDATDQPVPTSTLGLRRHAYFNSLASLGWVAFRDAFGNWSGTPESGQKYEGWLKDKGRVSDR
jgi:hypothetical protein